MKLTHRHPSSTARRRTRAVGLAVAALVAAALVAPSTGAQAAPAGSTPTPTGGATTNAGGAAATVGNGITTTDLSSVGLSPTSLATDLVGPGVTVSNVAFTGANAQAGLLHVVDPAVVSFNDGVIMSSGNVADIVGPNKSDGTTGDMAGSSDPDLTALIADTQTVNPTTFDAASLEFDFVPTASQVYFTYTFSSDEYLEWVNLFNDVFAFYVNGHNCATTPDGSAVSIDTINSTVNSNLFRDNSFSNPPANPINIESDGLSVEMICTAPVNPGVTNHMKLAIADTSDQILDSVVMIKAHSLSTTKPESCNDGVDNDDDTAVDMEDSSCQATTTPPPTGSAGVGSGGSAPAFTGNEGTPIKLDAEALGWTATPDTVSTTWTVHGINGTVGDCTIDPATPQPVGPDGKIAVVWATCPLDGEYVARVDGMDVEGKSAFDTDVDFFVHNAPPTVTIDTPSAGDQAGPGAQVSLSAYIADPGTGDDVTCEINWGDGTVEPGDVSSTSCTGSHSYGDPGTKLISVTASDSVGASAAAATLFEVTAANGTDTTLTSSVNPTVAGQSTNLVATVAALDPGAPVPTGSVEFYDGAKLVATKALKAGRASLQVAPTSSRTYTASYTGSVTADPSTSLPLDQQVVSAATTTSLTSSANPALTGQLVTLTASVIPVAPAKGTPTGFVDIYEDGALLSTRAMNGTKATLTFRPLAGHTYTASYQGSASYAPSTSSPLVEVVDQASTVTVLTPSANPAVMGQYVTYTAKVSPVGPAGGAPGGTVDIFQDGNLVATKALSSGIARWSVRLTAGHTYTATYYGAPGYGASASGTIVQQVNKATTKVTLSSSAATAKVGASGGVTATVSVVSPGSGLPSGAVSFFDDGAFVGAYPVVNGKAVLPLKVLGIGTHPITASYSGSAGFEASGSTVLLSQVITA